MVVLNVFHYLVLSCSRIMITAPLTLENANGTAADIAYAMAMQSKVSSPHLARKYIHLGWEGGSDSR